MNAEKSDLWPWYRLHTSSWIVLLSSVAALSVWCASPLLKVEAGDQFYIWRHGWPAVFLTRTAVNDTLWHFTAFVQSFRPWTLVLDLAALIAMSAVIGFSFEWRRRRRPRLFSAGLKEFFVLAAIAAATLGYWFQLRAKHREATAIIESLGGSSILVGVDQILPAWLRSWKNGQALRVGDAPAWIRLGEFDDPAVDFKALSKLTTVRILSVEGQTHLAIDAHAEFLRKMDQLEVLYLANSDLSDKGAANLASLTRLKRLALNFQITDAGLAHLSRLTQLQSLSIKPSQRNAVRGRARLQITDAGLAHLSGLTQLQFLSMMPSPGRANREHAHITDAGLMHLAGLTRLKTLELGAARLTQAGTEHLAGMQQLERLTLSADLDDEALEPIGRLKALDFVSLTAPRITHAGIGHLRGLKNLSQLTLQDTSVGDAGLREVCQISFIRELHFWGSTISDAGVVHLRGLPGLKSLSLAGSRISDACLDVLADLPNLQTLSVEDTMITDEGVAELLKKRPNLIVTW
jgi:Leucine-rich repeat (LRR) protein